MPKKIPLFYWSSVLFENRPAENYGDLLSQYIVEQVSGLSTVFYNAPKKRKSWFKKRHLLAIGSIMNYATAKSVVWGSGIIKRNDQVGGARFLAVRGPQSRKRVLELGYSCPKVYGDPGLLLPKFYNPQIEKQYELGVIPHYIDYALAQETFSTSKDTSVIDLIGDDLFATTDEILKCKRVISSSLHGLIIAHAYGIPAVWVRFSDKLTGDNVKFQDYFESVGLHPYSGIDLNKNESLTDIDRLFDQFPVLPDAARLQALSSELVSAFPSDWK